MKKKKKKNLIPFVYVLKFKFIRLFEKQNKNLKYQKTSKKMKMMVLNNTCLIFSHVKQKESLQVELVP